MAAADKVVFMISDRRAMLAPSRHLRATLKPASDSHPHLPRAGNVRRLLKSVEHRQGLPAT